MRLSQLIDIFRIGFLASAASLPGRRVLQPERLARLAKSPRTSKPKKSPVADEPEIEVAKPAAKTATKAAAMPDRELAARLPTMTDYQLRAYHMSTERISRDTAHPKSAAAKAALPRVEKEISRRATSPGVLPTPPRVGVARPKSDIRKGGRDRD